jgi:hypothetical protein
MKLALRVLLLTTVLETASLVFAEEMILTMMILVTIALSAAALVMGRGSAEALTGPLDDSIKA